MANIQEFSKITKQVVDFVIITKDELQSLIYEAVQDALNGKASNPPEAKKELITQDSLAQYLGKSVGTLINWRKQGLITAVKIGKSVFYDRERVLEEIAFSKKIG